MSPKVFSSLPLRASSLEHICWSCSRQLVQQQRPSARPIPRPRLFRSFNGAAKRSAATTNAGPTDSTTPRSLASRFRSGYFVSNGLLNQFDGGKNASSGQGTVAAAGKDGATASTSPHAKSDLPHRRRQAAKRAAASSSSSFSAPDSDPSDLPENASTILTDVAARQSSPLRRHLSAFLSLTKPRLTTVIVLSAMAPYALYPVPAFLAPAATAIPSLSPLTLLFLTTGTFLCSGSANALNMLYEQNTDARMSRTRNRPLVRALISRRAAILFAIAAGASGIALLELGVNPTVALLGAANIALYAGVYTPLKRVSPINTWVGALVGGIPPLMGWAAAAGESATTTTSSPWDLLLTPEAAGGWLFAALLFAWQFPHFMALSWTIRAEYKAAGLKMLSWTNPARNARVALRYGVFAFIPICVGLCAVGVTEWTFAVTSLPVNLWLARESVRFWRTGGAQGSARGLFWASVWHMPVVLVLALLQKKGMWGRVWRGLVGEPDVEEEWEDVDEVESGVVGGGVGGRGAQGR